MPVWILRVLPWASMTVGVLAAATYLFCFVRSPRHRTRSVLLVGACLGMLPTLYVVLVWVGFLADRYLRVARPVGALVASVATALVSWRLSALPARQHPARRVLVEILGIAACLSAGLAISGLDLGRPLDRLTVLVVIDRSRSIDLVPSADERVRTELRLAELSMRDDDRIGTVVFAANAATEDPPRPKSELAAPQKIELGRDGTDIGAGIRRALAELPADTAARLVIVSDGVANRGDAISAAAAAVAAEIPIDTVVLDQKSVPDIRVVALRMPARANSGETLEMRVVTSSSAPAEIRLRIKRDGRLIQEGTARIEAGEDVLRLRDKAPGAGLHRYDVEIGARDPALDQEAEDNTGSAFVRVRGPATALVLEGEPGKAGFVTRALKDAGFLAASGGLGSMPGDIGALAFYDVVFFSDIPAQDLSPSQLDAIGSYVRDLGGGLVLLGGDKSLGPGGYARTPVEEISPVSFDIKQEKRRASLAETILIDYSGSMAASAGGKTIKLDLANEAAARSASLLGAGDRLAVAHVDTVVKWTVPMGPVTDPDGIGKAIRAVKPGGGGIYTDLALRSGYEVLGRERVNLKHLLLFADGSDAEQLTGCRGLVSDAKRRGVTTSVVALGKGSDVPELEVLSRLGDGRFYLVEDANRLPAVFAQETILAARSAIHEIDFRTQVAAAGPPTRGVDIGSAPILRGYVVTIPKARATVLLTGPEGDPILATWSAGMGRAAAFTSDLKDRWGAHWTSWSGASTLVAQVARDVARLADDPHVRLECDTVGGELHVRAEVVGDDGRAQSFRRLTAHVAGPDGFTREMPVEPVGAGSYAASLLVSRPGTYGVTVRDEINQEPVGTTGSVLSAGEELRPTGSDRALLASISTMTGGKFRDSLAGVFRDRVRRRFSYHPLSSWLVAISALSLLLGVAARRLSVPAALLALPARVWHRMRLPRHAPAAVLPASAAVFAHLTEFHKRATSSTTGDTPTAPVSPVVAPRPYPVASRPGARAPADEPASLRAPDSSAQHGSQRAFTAAEILLQRRRGRRS